MIAGRVNLPGLATFAACLGLWELAERLGSVQFDYLPPPSAILGGIADLLRDGELVADIAHTLQAVLIGWVAAMLVGISLGMLLGYSTGLRRYTLATIEVLRPMPGIAFVPVALLLFGFSMQTEVMVIILPALWPILVNTMGGVMAVHRRLFDVGRTLRLSRGAVLLKILLPAAMPSIIVGARISLGLALVMAVIAEMIGNPQGLGYAVVREQQALRPDRMFGYVAAIGMLGIALNAAMLAIGRRLAPALPGAGRGTAA